MGGVTCPTLPKIEIARVLSLASNVSRTKTAKDLQDTLFLSTLCGGKSESKYSPLNVP